MNHSKNEEKKTQQRRQQPETGDFTGNKRARGRLTRPSGAEAEEGVEVRWCHAKTEVLNMARGEYRSSNVSSVRGG